MKSASCKFEGLSRVAALRTAPPDLFAIAQPVSKLRDNATRARLFVGWLVGLATILAFAMSPPITSLVLLLLPAIVTVLIIFLLNVSPVHCLGYLLLATLVKPIGQLDLGGKVPDIFLSDFALGAWFVFTGTLNTRRTSSLERTSVVCQLLAVLTACICTFIGPVAGLYSLAVFKVLLSGPLVLFCLGQTIRTPKHLAMATWFLIAFAVALSTMLLTQVIASSASSSIWTSLIHDKNVAAVSFGKSNYIAGIFVLLVPSVVGLVVQKGAARAWGIVFALVIGTAFIMCDSIGADVSLVIGFVVWLAVVRKGSIRVIAVLAALTMVLFVSIPAVFTEAAVGRFDGLANRSGNLVRVQVWQASWDTFLAHPLTGVGVGGLRSILMSATGRAAEINAHNFVLQALAESGIAGTILYVAPIVLAVIAGVRGAGKKGSRNNSLVVGGLLVGFTAGTLHGLVEVLHSGPQFTIIYWTIGGCLLSAARMISSPRRALWLSPVMVRATPATAGCL